MKKKIIESPYTGTLTRALELLLCIVLVKVIAKISFNFNFNLNLDESFILHSSPPPTHPSKSRELVS